MDSAHHLTDVHEQVMKMKDMLKEMVMNSGLRQCSAERGERHVRSEATSCECGNGASWERSGYAILASERSEATSWEFGYGALGTEHAFICTNLVAR